MSNFFGPYSKLRNAFDGEDRFIPASYSRIFDLYETASRQAYCTAQFSAKNGGIDNILCAQHFEAVARTVESCISAMISVDENDLIELPVFPKSLFK